jgi:hypothetical protein
MKKFALLFSFLLSCMFAFSQSIFLDAGPNVPADAPQGQPVLSYSLGSGNEVTMTVVTGAMSADLFLAAATGTPFSKIEMTVYDQNKAAYRITIHNSFVSTIQTGVDLTETVTFVSDKIKIKDFNH